VDSPLIPPPKDQYVEQAMAYVEKKDLDYFKACQTPTLLAMLGDVKGVKALDLGCGHGPYTRLLKQLGAREVLGLDLNPDMIAKAERMESEEKLGVEYKVYDCSDITDLPTEEKFDLIISVFFIPYMSSVDILTQLVNGHVPLLKPGGRIIHVFGHENRPRTYMNTAKYGVTCRVPSGELYDGKRYKTIFKSSDESKSTVTLTNHWYSHATFERIFKEAGFSQCRWNSEVVLSPEYEDQKEYFKEMMETPTFTIFEARF